MLSVLTRFFVIICMAFIAAFVVLTFWGVEFAIAAGISVLAIPLVYAYINLARLRKYILADTVENMPLPSGFWEEVFFRLQRLVRNLKQRIRSIEQQHDHFIEAFQASPNGIVMLDDNDQIEWCNAIAERFFGLIFKRDVMQRINFLIRRPEFVQYLNKRIFDEPLLLERMGTDGSLTLMLQAFPFGQKRHLLLIQDVTDLQNADAMRRDFVANVSHEMRTPITVLMGFLETVQSLELQKDQQDQYFDLMMAQAQRMKSLVEDLLTLANLESNALPASNTVVKVETLMALIKNDAEALSQGKHALSFDILSPMNLLGDEREILSAFSNLVSNAIRYTPEVGAIHVSWNQNEQGQGEFSVTDSGPGIASEHLSRLTERFYRVDRSRSRDTGGTGLGLAIVKHIANRHQAQLVIESTPGKGSKFLLRFPQDRLAA
ncbi:phosphate regulon sensor histidine kinase PhoR [Polynucleobacter wuianus]|uniref:Phosphate regulon sensor protein PhoR n=1 Tax=Polynucleobacter wuianus TaxID=1743168 RepID=A0A191UEM2_9BURK|nr:MULTISPECIES: phosphate regulon sensor histidine kinase PhoR [Polynucleobacter]ANI99498.1 phosphate regulon sensor histidine kinase PhoR [Polynucleobacter wuianus]MBU3551882.1 phosphate regulon sensor histidine kinase PhoR [Polynucleobacter sp. MWH-Post4-6-1]MBU3609304.1 phosphate regulon sensor histidine kinase PhoR [Polynucleobacter wuianus]